MGPMVAYFPSYLRVEFALLACTHSAPKCAHACYLLQAWAHQCLAALQLKLYPITGGPRAIEDLTNNRTNKSTQRQPKQLHWQFEKAEKMSKSTSNRSQTRDRKRSR